MLMKMSAVQEQKLGTMVPDEFICHRLQKKSVEGKSHWEDN